MTRCALLATAAVALALGAAAPAHAGPIKYNDNIFDYGGYTFDKSTGLSWLDVTATSGLSYNQVTTLIASNNSYNGVSLGGWRYATSAELINFMGSISGMAPSRTMYAQDSPYGGSWVDAAIGLLGATRDGRDYGHPDELLLTKGLLLESGGLAGELAEGLLEDTSLWAEVMGPDRFVIFSDGRSPGSVPKGEGSFLVRAGIPGVAQVPEPTTITLLGTALFGFGAVRLRWRRSAGHQA